MRKLCYLLATFLLIASCSKNIDKELNVNQERKSSNLLDSFGGYEIWSAPWTIQNEIFNVSPDTNAQWQLLNEYIYYTAYALKEMVSVGAYPNLVSDIKQNLDSDSELLVNNFFLQYPTYKTAASNILNAAFGVDFDYMIKNAVDVNGVQYSIALMVPINTLNGADDFPVIAMGIELEGPNHDDVEDYDEDFIPAFWHENNYIESAIGYNDAADYKNSELITTSIIVVSTAAVLAAANWFLARKVFDVDPNTIIGTGTTGPPGCEKAQKLTCTSMSATKRFQRYGKSRVRMNYDVHHPLDPKAKVDGYKKMFKIGNMKKSEVPKVFNVPFSLNGYDFHSTSSKRDQPPNGFYFLGMTFEYDWYATKKGFRVELPSIGIKTVTVGRMKRVHEYYERFWIPDFDWCFQDYRTYNGAGHAIIKGL